MLLAFPAWIMEMLKAFIHIKVTEQHNDEVEDQDEQIMGTLKYLT